MDTPERALSEDRSGYGLGFNIEHVIYLNKWSYGQVAEQMYPGELPDGPNRLSARKELAQVIDRKQKRWRRHLPALARAWNLPEAVLLFDDLRRCATLNDLEQHYGFRRLDVIKR
ncbi:MULTISPECIES: hypothetical protein [unclassified Paraburkholderia]|uniref:hypothetical protein n=1 Tax=unclassified Paraburkholderia TaxID=2615204 RepID=UPI00160896BD|nr:MULTISPECIES: hypothetical protein [unclassified Paraburkholderia]MBB5445343.1 hypothetical protein [Paraburkholderia sp. WSM4177]MBB5485891.1 hypothetical protein [Paraburkholderia sp. WSM4180]